MKTVKISLNSIDKVKAFVNEISKYQSFKFKHKEVASADSECL